MESAPPFAAVRGDHRWRMAINSIFYLTFFYGCVTEGAGSRNVISISRHYQGDIYVMKEIEPSYELDISCQCGPGSFRVGPPKECRCQCVNEQSTLRDDTMDCISDVHECTLAEFVSSTHAEKIPYVYIPKKGQLVHPTAEIALLEIDYGSDQPISPVCIVTRGQFLTENGWQDIKNSSFEAPFRLAPDSGKTYLQWAGDSTEKLIVQGRVILVQLLCRDASKSKRTLFHPCVAFRVAGSPSAEELFSSQGDSNNVVAQESVLSTGEALAIALVLGGLILAYAVVSVIYWKLKQYKKRLEEEHRNNHQEDGISTMSKNSLQRSQVIEYHNNAKNKLNYFPRTSLVSSEDDSECDDLEDLSEKPKSTANKEKSPVTFTTAVVHDEEIYSTPSEEEEVEGRRQRLERLKMAKELQKSNAEEADDEEYEITPPSFGLSVVETLANTTVSGARSLGIVGPKMQGEGEAEIDDSLSIQNKKKLFFNLSYFEPENLQSPPPGAVEFLTKIREMISVAKDKMQNKTFQPSLIDIPEDDYSLRTSRAPSTLSNGASSSRVMCTVDKSEAMRKSPGAGQEPIYNEVLDQQPSVTHSESKPAAGEEGSKPNTLKRLAERVNTHGHTLVSEIIRTLDLKPRLPDSLYSAYPSAFTSTPSLAQKPVNAAAQGNGETQFPELVKPSMLRNVLNKDMKLTQDLNNTFENFRQEIRATLSKVKGISPISSLNRNKNKKSFADNPEDSRKSSENGEAKVQKWLQSLEGRSNPYSKIDDVSSLISNKPRLPARSFSFSHSRESSSISSLNNIIKDLGNKEDSRIYSAHQNLPHGKSGNDIVRSHSFQRKQVLSNSLHKRQQNPLLDENKNYSVNQYVNNALSKVPKVPSSCDTDSEVSDVHSRYKDSLEYSSMQFTVRSMPAIPSCSNIVNGIKNETDSLSLVDETNMNTYGTGIFGNPFNSDHDNSYEEIQFGNGSLRRKTSAALKLFEARAKGHIQEIHVGTEDNDEIRCGIYSNPESLVSEIHISDDKPIGTNSSDNRLSIEVNDSLSSEGDDAKQSPNFKSGKKKKQKVKRNDSIIQDSLERPKVKKKLSNASRNNSFKNEEKTLKSTTTTGKDFTVKEISLNSQVQEYDKPTSDCTSDKDESTKVRRSKTMRTFKDYQFMKFSRKNFGNCQLSVFGEGINLNYKSTSPANDPSLVHRPPLPPKHLKPFEDNSLVEWSMKSSTDSDVNIPPSIPPKHKLKHSVSLSSDLQRKLLKKPSTYSDEAPVLPPKLKIKQNMSENSSVCTPEPYEPTNLPNTLDSLDSEPPKLPEKSRKKADTLSRSSSKDSIPELTKDEERSILHGVLASSPPDPKSSFKTTAKNFLDDGNIACSDDLVLAGNVPIDTNQNYPSPSEEKYIEDPELNKENVDTQSVTQKSRNITESVNLSQPYGEEMIRGQFILSNHRLPTLHRQSSLKKNSNTAPDVQTMTSDFDQDPFAKSSDGPLSLKIKAELEKHFKENSGADSIKRIWRRVMEKVDSSSDREKLTIKDIQRYILSLDLESTEYKSKNDDSGYHSSTDSSDSSRIRNYRLKDPLRPLTLKPLLKRSDTIAISGGLRKFASGIMQRSASLQQLLPGTVEFGNLKDSLTLKRDNVTPTVERRKDCSSPKMSVYVNNSFSIECE